MVRTRKTVEQETSTSISLTLWRWVVYFGRKVVAHRYQKQAKCVTEAIKVPELALPDEWAMVPVLDAWVWAWVQA
jgi:hypothetical protein